MKMYRFKYQETDKEPKIDFFEVQEIRDGTEYILKIGTYAHTIFDGDVGKINFDKDTRTFTMLSLSPETDDFLNQIMEYYQEHLDVCFAEIRRAKRIIKSLQTQLKED